MLNAAICTVLIILGLLLTLFLIPPVVFLLDCFARWSANFWADVIDRVLARIWRD